MAISSQLPQIVVLTRANALQSLALQAGQVLEAQVIGPAPNGGTQVQIAGQMLNLVLPTAAQAGTTLKLEVQGSGAQAKLVLRPSAPAPSQSPTTPLQPSPVPQAVLPPIGTSTQAAPLPAAAPPANLPSVPLAAPLPMSAGGSAAQTMAASFVPSALPSDDAAQVLHAAAIPGLPVGQKSEAGLGTAGQTLAPHSASSVALQQPATTARAGGAIYPTSNSQQAGTGTMAPPAQAVTPSLSGTASSHGPVPAAISTPVPTPVLATTPQAALAQMVQAALPGQDSVAGLMNALSSTAGKVAMPLPVVRAMQQLFASQVPLDNARFNGAALKQAVLNSGVFQEASLASGQMPAQMDQKIILLALRQALTNWVGPQAALGAAVPMAPPLRGQPPRAKPATMPPIEPTAPPEEIGKHLLERTEASLSRLRLHQNASLPDPVTQTTADWSMDLPVLVGTQQTVLHLQIHREPESQSQTVAERGWQMRFALSLPQMGEVGAQVSLRGGATGVMLWATERQTSQALEAHIIALRQTLSDIGMRPGAVLVRHGEPPAAPPSASGHFLDART